jgi:hypothetical protein
MFGTSRWADVDSGDGHVYRFGVSLRVMVDLEARNFKAGLTLPQIAADVEVSDATASAQLIVRGYSGAALGKLLPPWQSFDVDSYAQYMAAISAIQTVIFDDPGGVVPELLSTTLAEQIIPDSAQSIGTVLALNAIVAGDSLATALANLQANLANFPDVDPNVVLAQVRATVEHVYADLCVSDGHTPDGDAATKAKIWLAPLARSQHWWHRHK